MRTNRGSGIYNLFVKTFQIYNEICGRNLIKLTSLKSRFLSHFHWNLFIEIENKLMYNVNQFFSK